MFIMTAELWDELSRINNSRQDFDWGTGVVYSDERLPDVVALLDGYEADIAQVDYTGSDGFPRKRIRLHCLYEGDERIVVMGRGIMWVEEV
jgi:hypothetical protein